MEAGHLSTLLEREGGKLPADPFKIGERDRVALDPGGVVGVEALEDRRGGGGCAGDGDRPGKTAAGAAGKAPLEGFLNVRLEGGKLLRSRRVVVQMALAHPHHPGLEGVVEGDLPVDPYHHLGGAAADVDHRNRSRQVAAIDGALEGEEGLLLAGEKPGVKAEAVANVLDELLAVGGVPDGGGKDCPVGRAAVFGDQGGVLGEDGFGALERGWGEAAGRINPFAKPRHLGAADPLIDGSIGPDPGD